MNEKLKAEFADIESGALRCVGIITSGKLVETVVRQCFEAACRYDAASVASGNAAAPAFPSSPVFNPESTDGQPWRPVDIGCAGLTKRERFAMAAMQGLLADSEVNSRCAKLADMSVNYADALLERLSHV